MSEMNQAYLEYARETIEQSTARTVLEFLDYVHMLLGMPSVADAAVER